MQVEKRYLLFLVPPRASIHKTTLLEYHSKYHMRIQLENGYIYYDNHDTFSEYVISHLTHPISRSTIQESDNSSK